MTENNLQQAMLPEGCTVLSNDWGTAPGCAFEAEGVRVSCSPVQPGSAGNVHPRGPALSCKSGDGTILSRSCGSSVWGSPPWSLCSRPDERHDQPHPGPLCQGGDCGAAH
jgi:hypothetical protein